MKKVLLDRCATSIGLIQLLVSGLVSYIKPISDNMYEITADTTTETYYLRKGYKLKSEQIKRKELKEAYSLIDKFKNTDTFSVALFDLNDHTLKTLIEEDNEILYNSILVK